MDERQSWRTLAINLALAPDVETLNAARDAIGQKLRAEEKPKPPAYAPEPRYAGAQADMARVARTVGDAPAFQAESQVAAAEKRRSGGRRWTEEQKQAQSERARARFAKMIVLPGAKTAAAFGHGEFALPAEEREGAEDDHGDDDDES